MSAPCGNLALSISKATMLMIRIQIGESRSSGSFLTKLMAVTHWDSSLQTRGIIIQMWRKCLEFRAKESGQQNGFNCQRQNHNWRPWSGDYVACIAVCCSTALSIFISHQLCIVKYYVNILHDVMDKIPIAQLKVTCAALQSPMLLNKLHLSKCLHLCTCIHVHEFHVDMFS